jgi:hypothetical protein
MTTAGSIFATDLGTNTQFQSVWLGPSLGWQLLPVAPELYISTPGALIVPPFASRLLLTAAGVGPITLPSVSEWLTAQLGGSTIANQACFDRSLWIKDYAYAASALTPIVVLPSGADTIDQLASFSIVEAGAMIELYPLTDCSGWFVGGG